MSEQIKSRIEALEKEKQSILDQINSSPAIARVHQLTGAIAELQQLLPKEEPKDNPEKEVTPTPEAPQ